MPSEHLLCVETEAAWGFGGHIHHTKVGKASKFKAFSSLICKKRELKEMTSKIPSGSKKVLIVGHF